MIPRPVYCIICDGWIKDEFMDSKIERKYSAHENLEDCVKVLSVRISSLEESEEEKNEI